MQGETHLVVGLATGLTVALATDARDPVQIVACAGVAGVAALIPDWVQINAPGVSKSIKGITGHRGISHWVWIPLILSYLARSALNAPDWLLIAFLCGWLSHIILDAFSNGVPAFWPWRLRLATIKTGGRTDKLTGGAALVVSIALIAFML
jgi:membrane-bound metal-dependent hydrolase YbcI (DUF457 family)